MYLFIYWTRNLIFVDKWWFFIFTEADSISWNEIFDNLLIICWDKLPLFRASEYCNVVKYWIYPNLKCCLNEKLKQKGKAEKIIMVDKFIFL